MTYSLASLPNANDDESASIPPLSVSLSLCLSLSLSVPLFPPRCTCMVQRFGRSHFLANLGHAYYPDMNPEQVKTLIDAIHQACQKQ